MEELLRGVLHGITLEPARFLAEVVQSALLLVIIGWAGGRYVRGRLAERRERIAGELARAEAAERDSVRFREEARAAAARGEAEAPAVVRTAREQAEHEREASIARSDTEAEQMIVQARDTVEREKNRILGESSERLIHLTTETARRYLDEMLTEGERRALTQKAILESLEEMERGSPPSDAVVT